MPIDDSVADRPPGDTAPETAIVKVSPSEAYDVGSQPITSNIADDTSWYYSNWSLKDGLDEAVRSQEALIGTKVTYTYNDNIPVSRTTDTYYSYEE